MNKHNQRTLHVGFTLVELLIVIVVIAILAAISIVAFNGVQQRAKTTASQAAAESVTKKASVWSTVQGSYPDVAQLRTNSLSPPDIDTPSGSSGPVEARLDDPTIAIGASMNEVRSENGKVVTYTPCGPTNAFTGATITYWNFIESNTATVTTGACP